MIFDALDVCRRAGHTVQHNRAGEGWYGQHTAAIRSDQRGCQVLPRHHWPHPLQIPPKQGCRCVGYSQANFLAPFRAFLLLSSLVLFSFFSPSVLLLFSSFLLLLLSEIVAMVEVKVVAVDQEVTATERWNWKLRCLYKFLSSWLQTFFLMIVSEWTVTSVMFLRTFCICLREKTDAYLASTNTYG